MAQEHPNVELLYAVVEPDLERVKELIEVHGADPNLMIKDGEPPHAYEYNACIGSFSEHKELLERLDEKRMGRLTKKQREKLQGKLQAQREVSAYLITKMHSTKPDKDDTILESLLNMDMEIGVPDAFVLDLMDMGYDLKNDEGTLKYIGILSFDVAMKVLEYIGFAYSDGTALTSAASWANWPLFFHLAEKGLNPNVAMEFYGTHFGGGGKSTEYALHALARHAVRHTGRIKRFRDTAIVDALFESDMDVAAVMQDYNKGNDADLQEMAQSTANAVNGLKILLELGADKTLKNDAGQTALEEATGVAEYGMPPQLAELLA